MNIDVSQKYQEFKEEFTNYSILNKKDALLLAVSKKKPFAQILELNTILEETKNELSTLKQETSNFDTTLEDASSNLEGSVTLISGSIANIEEGSSQLNALLFPIVASIAIILALQIVIIARRR